MCKLLKSFREKSPLYHSTMPRGPGVVEQVISELDGRHGWKLVPVKSTDQMANAALARSLETDLDLLANTEATRQVVDAAITASPDPLAEPEKNGN